MALSSLFVNVLMLVCHRDDEVLSAGGTLLQCDNLHLMYFNDSHPLVNKEIYDQEAENVKKYLNCNVSYSEFKKVNQLETYPIAFYIKEIEDIINKAKPETLIIPYPSYNQDHRVIFDAAITASRVHDRNHYVKTVLVAEQPETLQTNRLDILTRPQLFVPINIEDKLNLYHIYGSQQREHRSDHHLRSLAGIRGMQCNTKYAEAFYIIRMTHE
jgi:LmbE family N-acetylglucosaminyl deacetylase